MSSPSSQNDFHSNQLSNCSTNWASQEPIYIYICFYSYILTYKYIHIYIYNMYLYIYHFNPPGASFSTNGQVLKVFWWVKPGISLVAILLVVATWHQWVDVVDFVVAQVGSMGQGVVKVGVVGFHQVGCSCLINEFWYRNPANAPWSGECKGTATFTQPEKIRP